MKFVNAETGKPCSDPKGITFTRLFHKTLPDGLLRKTRFVYKIIGHYLGQTLEHFEAEFLRDMHPEKEILIWCRIAIAWQLYHHRHLQNRLVPTKDEKHLIAILCTLSSGVEISKFKGSDKTLAKRLWDCFVHFEEGLALTRKFF